MPRPCLFLLTVVATVLCLIVNPAFVHAYEFHLLGGMVVKGDLKDFRSGVFYLETEFGEMTINADKLDYIIVEPDDASGARGAVEGVLELGVPSGPGDWTPEKVDVPAALEGFSIRAGEAPPAIDGYSRISEKPQYPGTFAGAAAGAAPTGLEGRSLSKGEPRHPGTFRGVQVTGEEVAGVSRDTGAASPPPYEGHSIIGKEDASEAYPGRFMPAPDNSGKPGDGAP